MEAMNTDGGAAVDEAKILAIMTDYFADRGISVDNLPDSKLSERIPESMETIEFLIHVEETLGLKEGAIDLNSIGPRIADRTFSEIAREIRHYMASGGDGQAAGKPPEGEKVGA